MSGRLVFGREHLVKLCQQGLPAGFHAGSDLRHGGGQFGQVLVHQGEGRARRVGAERDRQPRVERRALPALRADESPPPRTSPPRRPSRSTSRNKGWGVSLLACRPRPNAPSRRKGSQTRPRCVGPASRKRPSPARAVVVEDGVAAADAYLHRASPRPATPQHQPRRIRRRHRHLRPDGASCRPAQPEPSPPPAATALLHTGGRRADHPARAPMTRRWRINGYDIDSAA
jgi:hypothetical protein